MLLLSLFFAYGSRRIWKYAAMTFVQLLYFLAVGVLFLLALRSSSLQEVIVVLRMIGMLSAVVYLVLWLVVLLQCMGTLQRYRRALLVHPSRSAAGKTGKIRCDLAGFHPGKQGHISAVGGICRFFVHRDHLMFNVCLIM